jgi:hypothetical protein
VIGKITTIVSDWGAGRRASVLTREGVVAIGSIAPIGYELLSQRGCSIVVSSGLEVVVDICSESGVLLIDWLGAAQWQPSDMGSGGFTKHRALDGKSRRRVSVLLASGEVAVELFPIDRDMRDIAQVLYGKYQPQSQQTSLWG